MTAVIDRFEGSWAVVEYDGATFNFPKAFLPRDAREGDVLKFSVIVNSAGTTARRKSVKKIENELFK